MRREQCTARATKCNHGSHRSHPIYFTTGPHSVVVSLNARQPLHHFSLLVTKFLTKHTLWKCLVNGLTHSAAASETAPPVSYAFFAVIVFRVYPLIFHAGLLSFFCPCIQFGRNAESLGESCFLYALSQFVPLLNLYCRVSVRGRIREQKGIEGSCFKDLLCAWCCAPCSLAQEGQVSY